MIDQIEARLRLVALTAPDRAVALGLDLDRAGEVLAPPAGRWPTASSATP